MVVRGIIYHTLLAQCHTCRPRVPCHGSIKKKKKEKAWETESLRTWLTG